MKKLLIIVCIATLFINCNNNGGLGGGGWSAADRQKGLKACMDGVEGKLDNAAAKKFCNCALEKAMKTWKTYAESEAAPDDDPAGNEIGRSCMAAIQGGGGEDNPDDGGKGKGGGLFGGGGWSKTDKNTFSTQCQQSLVGTGYDENGARQLCDCILQKIQKKYSSLQEADAKGGAQAGAQARQECEGGGMNGSDDGAGNDEDN